MKKKTPPAKELTREPEKDFEPEVSEEKVEKVDKPEVELENQASEGPELEKEKSEKEESEKEKIGKDPNQASEREELKVKEVKTDV